MKLTIRKWTKCPSQPTLKPPHARHPHTPAIVARSLPPHGPRHAGAQRRPWRRTSRTPAGRLVGSATCRPTAHREPVYGQASAYPCTSHACAYAPDKNDTSYCSMLQRRIITVTHMAWHFRPRAAPLCGTARCVSMTTVLLATRYHARVHTLQATLMYKWNIGGACGKTSSILIPCSSAMACRHTDAATWPGTTKRPMGMPTQRTQYAHTMRILCAMYCNARCTIR